MTCNSLLTGAIRSVYYDLLPGESTFADAITFALCWYMPVVHFGDRKINYERFLPITYYNN